MKISIITPTFNSAEHLQECINSVLLQSYKNIEHIIVDGKSTDDTVDIIRKNEHHIHSWISETDRGMYDAINKGMKMATGDIVGVLNSDDFYASNDTLAKIVEQFIEHPEIECVYGDLNFVFKYNTDKIYRTWVSSAYDRKKFLKGWMPPHPTFYHKRSLLEQYGYYENHFYSSADYELMCRFLYKHHVKAMYIPLLMIHMRTGGMSNGSLKKRFRANRRDYLAMKKNGIPFPFFTSIFKPITKLHQYKEHVTRKVNPLKKGKMVLANS